MREPRGFAVVLPILAAFLAAPAHAVDGVIEINQAKVMAGGGFPFSITAGGSYRLTSNLDILAAGQPAPGDKTAIQVIVSTEPSTVDLDLNGFSIVGPFVCSYGPPLNCPPGALTGTGHGIYVSAGSLRLHGGVIQGFAGNCVQALGGAQNQITNLDARWCTNGVVTGLGVLENVTASQNRGQGVNALRSVLHRIFSQQNGDDGISIFESTLDGCVSSKNAKDGVQADEDTFVSSCVVLDNGEYGLHGSSNGECGYRGNTLAGNASGDVIDCVAAAGTNVCGGVLCP